VATYELARHIAGIVNADPPSRALEFHERWYTWSDMAEAMARIDAVIDTHTRGQSAVVGVLVRNKPVHVAVLLALLRRGGCFVVINPARGREAVRSDVSELRLPLVLGDPGDIGLQAGACDGTTLAGLADLEAEPQVGDLPARPADGPAHPGVAVRMLTSGTTGPPKRIDLTYEALAASMAGVTKYYESSPHDVVRRPRGVAIVNSPLAHLGGVFRVLQCVLDRRPFVLLEKFEVETWLRAVRQYRPKTVSLVPAALRMVLEARPDPSDLASLRAVTSGTAPLSPDDADAFTDRYRVPVLTSYAATEFAGGVASWTLRDYHEYWRAKRGSVGRVQPGSAIRVTDEHSGAELAAGQAGLLEVKPAQLGQGIDWVRTNDLARIDADGFLYILGRADRAIIRGGFKVLPDRVATILERHPDVRAAVVIGLPDERLGAVPAALVELRPGAAGDVAAIMELAADSLAGYELPVELRFTPELPRTASGKVDLRATEELLRRIKT
jgi:acyl-CoA synthetase (AMP-forming)/AMP-acid ligase II